MSLTVRELLENENITDAVILRHGFTDYMRDYEIIVGGRNGLPYTDVHKYQFIGCAEAVYTTRLVRTFHEPTSTFGQSLADELVFADIRYSFLGHEPEITIKKDYPLKINENTSDGSVSYSQNAFAKEI